MAPSRGPLSAHSSPSRRAASFGLRSRVNTPLKFTDSGRWSACAVAKSANAQIWVPATFGCCPASTSSRSISAS